MNENILVSIIIPVYNGEKYISDTIQSVIDQTYKNWELIIVDDGSTDNTAEIVKQFNDSRISYIKKNNTGVSDTRNVGAMISKGEILSFLDADDIWLPENLEKKVEKLINEPQCVLVYSSMFLWDERENYKNCRIIKK
ncbi:MAG TPA: glycosyltransferase family A protein, partial [Bacteroidales bacterium]|nr:glycosyltransferase family A protein [Bacteroidales bacterium]